MAHNMALQMIDEMKEFATFSPASQRYIRRSLDVAFGRRAAAQLWARDSLEEASIAAQALAYRLLETIRSVVPDDAAPSAAEEMLTPLITVTTFDLAEGRLESFTAYRFLYERLLGAEIRPWLPMAFCAASAMPCLHPTLRTSLLRSISEAAAGAAGWSCRQPAFLPQWVEKVPVPVAL